MSLSHTLHPCSQCRKREYLQEKWELLNCHKYGREKRIAKQVTLLYPSDLVPGSLLFFPYLIFVCETVWSSCQSLVYFLNVYQSVDLGNSNYLLLAYDREAEISLLSLTVAHFPCLSQIEQNQVHISFTERHRNLFFFFFLHSMTLLN